MSCQICFTNKPFYICPDCNTKMCKTCLKKYILEYSNLEPHCMSCMSKLSFNTIFSIFGSKEFDKYLDKAAEIKFNVELQKIPECIECCKVITNIKNVKDEIPSDIIRICETLLKCGYSDDIDDEEDIPSDYMFHFILKILNDILLLTPSHAYDEECIITMLRSLQSIDFSEEQYKEIIETLNNVIKMRFNTTFDLNILKYKSLSEKSIMDKFIEKITNKKLGKAGKQNFLFRCENNDCKGFVNVDFRCELCNHEYCPDCFADITNSIDHKCKKEDVMTAKEIMESTKPCPKCAASLLFVDFFPIFQKHI